MAGGCGQCQRGGWGGRRVWVLLRFKERMVQLVMRKSLQAQAKAEGEVTPKPFICATCRLLLCVIGCHASAESAGSPSFADVTAFESMFIRDFLAGSQ